MTAIERPAFAAGVRLRFDDVRGSHVLLFPEGALTLNDSAAAILELVDGRRTTDEIIDALSQRYTIAADDLAADVRELLDATAARGHLRDAA